MKKCAEEYDARRKSDHGNETKLVWTHMQDEGQQAGEGGDVWNDGKRIEKRKTVVG